MFANSELPDAGRFIAKPARPELLGENLYRKGDVWSCAKGLPEKSRITGTTVATMRIIDLLPA
jgi:hypothetical protein